MSSLPSYDPRREKEIMADIWTPSIADNPFNYAKYVFPWGKERGPLEHKSLRTWQAEELAAIASHIEEQKSRMALGLDPLIYQSATASGRGVGKSTLTALLIHWFLSTRLGGTVIVTANTETQLKSRTWAEVGKWHTLSLNHHWFEKTALSLKPFPWFENEIKKPPLQIDTGYYYAQAQLWSEETPDAFAGVHNEKGVLVIFDEASGIPQPIWTVTEGFFTEPILDRYFFAFSNPRRNTGAFFECFHKYRDSWRTRNLDSRTVEGTDKAFLQSIIDKYGEDSDEARVEVKGQFPRRGDNQFISREVIEEATLRPLQEDPYAPLILGIDPARFGHDSTVFRWRQGRDARSIPALTFKGKDNMEIAALAAEWIEKTNPDAVCVDAGNGVGVIDRLRALNFKVHEVWFGGKADNEAFANKRTEMWARMEEWLRDGGCIDDSSVLKDDLAGPEYKFMGSSDKKMLESKEDMKKRGLHSPDHGDALACTFAVKVARRDLRTSRLGAQQKKSLQLDTDYPIFS